MTSRVVDLDQSASVAKHTHYRPPEQTISLIVCTRNRAAKLRQLIKALLSLETPAEARIEYIVVDNGSTDETPQVYANAAEMFGDQLRWIRVAKPGVGHARNMGLAQAGGDILAFIDDDVVPRRDWLKVICREFAGDADLALLSGQVQLCNSRDLPVSIRTRTERGQFSSIADAFSLLAGCHFAVRREFVERIGGFDDDFGVGTRFPVEDADFFYRIWRAGGKLIYEPRMYAWHDHGRRSTKDRREIARSYMVGRGAFYSKHTFAGDRLVLQALYWELTGLVKALLRGTSRYGWRSLGWLLGGFGGYAATLAWRPARKANRNGDATGGRAFPRVKLQNAR